MPRALILVDIQNDFLPGGVLAVADADAILPVVNGLLPKFETVVATQDWHPPNHGSFAANHAGKEVGETISLDGLPQILWPVHCVQGEAGAEFSEALEAEQFTAIFPKGTNPQIDSYSGFFDNGHRQATGLGNWLKQCGISDVYIAGLATDYCVKFTALDAVELGFNTYLIRDACRGVNLADGDVSKAIEEMQQTGVKVIDSDDVK